MKMLKVLLALWIAAGAWLQAQDAGLEIERSMRAEPALRNVYIKVDRYGDLAVMHGWVIDKKLRAAAERSVRATAGVTTVYNYVTYDESEDINRAIDMGRRVQLNGATIDDRVLDTLNLPYVTTPSTLSVRVKQRLDGDPTTSPLDVRVDTYGALVLLHGNIADWNAARDVERVAASTPGVERVYSYLTTAAAAELPSRPWPVVVDLNIDQRDAPVYVKHPDEPRERDPSNPNAQFR